jgi:pantetheine-phosphate adenylyltransferase
VLVQALNALRPRLIVAIGVHPGKTPMFSFEERADLIRSDPWAMRVRASGANVEVVAFSITSWSMRRGHTARRC